MFDRNGMSRERRRVRAIIEREGKDPFEAYLFLGRDERMSDLVNDERDFIPAEALDGRTIIIAKKCLIEITPCGDGDFQFATRGSDPYALLGIEASASDEDVVVAYRKTLKGVHPDAVEAAGLDRRLIAAADVLTKQVLDAYKGIVAERRAARAVAEPEAIAAE